ncbi:MAG TPA: tetratricopeptide repeat protein, partial [Gemmatimonadales bacterium]|nr:tetratricopeptide repeat protein [Gemmatimonadales bacterium]
MTPPPPDSPDPVLVELRGEYAAIETLLAAPNPARRDEAKRRIIALFKRVDGLLTGLGGVKEEIRGLVDRYKQQAAEEGGGASGPGAVRPQLRRDHLGASTFIEKGWSLISLGDPQGAIQALTRALELSPDDVQAQSLLGWAQMQADRPDEALATFSRVLVREPANALARVNVGYICLRKRIFGEAIEHLSRVIRLDNDAKATLYAHYYLGLVYLERAMYLDAQTFLRKALMLGPNLIEAYYDLGRAQWFSGQTDAARATWEQGAGANRFAPWARRCQEVLDRTARGEEVPR